VVQDWVVNWSLSINLHYQRLVPLVSQSLALLQNGVTVDFTSLLDDSALFEQIKAYDVVLVEILGPSLWDAILDLVFDSLFVGAFCKGRSKGLFMKLIELVIKLSNHLLDVSTLFLHVKLGVDCFLDLSLVKQPLRDLRSIWLLVQDVSNLR